MSEYTEAELIISLAEHMKMCRETSRALAHMRRDPRWLKVTEHFFTLGEKLAKLAKAPSKRIILS